MPALTPAATRTHRVSASSAHNLFAHAFYFICLGDLVVYPSHRVVGAHCAAFHWLEKQEPKLKLTDVHDGLTVDMLRKHLRCRRLKHQGLKKDLIDRLKADVIRQQ